MEDVFVGVFFGLAVGCYVIVVNVLVDILCLNEVDLVFYSLE